MSPEKFHDALNYLDDDLIQQTDDLRQGRRVLQTRPTARQVITWAAPAACLVLALGLAPRLLPTAENCGTANYGQAEMNQEAGEQPKELQDYMTTNSGEQSRHDCAGTEVLQDLSCGNISLYIPENWTYELESGEDGSYFIVIRPPQEEGAIRVGYSPNFGVCGTGLSTEEQVIAGMNARVGTYDDNQVWSFITFSGAGEGYVVLNEGDDEWWDVYGDAAMEILETIVIAEKE